MKNLLLLLSVSIIMMSGCQPPVKSDPEKVARELREKSIRDSIQKAKNDSIKKIEDERKAYESRPWKLDRFVDNFGDPTGEKYIKSYSSGIFSNSATNGDDLYVKLLVTRSSIGLFLYEYSNDNAAEKFIGGGTVLAKNEAGEKVQVGITGDWNSQGGINIGGGHYSKLIAFMKKSTGRIKFVVYDDYSSKYNFEVDMRGFNDEFSLLSKK